MKLILAVITTAAVVSAQDWPNWRGPNHNGSTEAQGLPVKFSQRK